MTSWLPELRLLRHPVAGYRDLAREPGGAGVRLLLRRPALHALLLGGAISLSTTGRLVFPLFLSTTACWSFVPALQFGAVALVARLLGCRSVPLARLVDLYFAGNVAWSLWLLAIAGTHVLHPFPTPGSLLPAPASLVGVSLLAVFLCSKVLTFGFFRGALGMTLPRTFAGLVLHDLFLWGSVILFFFVSDQLWPRILGALHP